MKGSVLFYFSSNIIFILFFFILWNPGTFNLFEIGKKRTSFFFFGEGRITCRGSSAAIVRDDVRNLRRNADGGGG